MPDQVKHCKTALKVLDKTLKKPAAIFDDFRGLPVGNLSWSPPICASPARHGQVNITNIFFALRNQDTPSFFPCFLFFWQK
uniref:Uncharacterized protein n=1 Tax=Aegilops tauschii subsp. strangulata TaxID=200361 RepID=A0A453HI92_AEGTS